MTESRQTRLQVKCPTCQTTVVWKPENAFRPFCSQRCMPIRRIARPTFRCRAS
ncbi:DNA gyrase inhibitor YacG, partial [Enterobacter hormaechei subsp. steigerwaltii]|nr:DNA gyrase inhibitor YacG [Enterobacter hormaechei subsp. steigerwaltii]